MKKRCGRGVVFGKRISEVREVKAAGRGFRGVSGPWRGQGKKHRQGPISYAVVQFMAPRQADAVTSFLSLFTTAGNPQSRGGKGSRMPNNNEFETFCGEVLREDTLKDPGGGVPEYWTSCA